MAAYFERCEIIATTANFVYLGKKKMQICRKFAFFFIKLIVRLLGGKGEMTNYLLGPVYMLLQSLTYLKKIIL